jgi:MFS family permease
VVTTYLLTTGALTLAGGGMAVGVLAGGVLTTWFGWRSVFLINVPAGLAVLAARASRRSGPPRGLRWLCTEVRLRGGTER